jgi:hypothetical protein
MNSTPPDVLPSSFRDPSGFLFRREGRLYRQINQRYRDDYNLLMSSGLYDRLVERGLLLRHTEVGVPPANPETADRVIQPEFVPFISHPYEWCFSQLLDAARLTLQIQKLALGYGMSLKDASAFNIQFHNGKPALIDTLSFERYTEGKPWVAYRQFCQHFLAPLTLAAYRDVRLTHLTAQHLDGIPLDLASRLLPWKTRLSFPIQLHIHLHARSQMAHSDRPLNENLSRRGMSRRSFLGLIDSLESAVGSLKWRLPVTEWGNYYEDTNYSAEARNHKAHKVEGYIERAHPQSVWDFGANLGLFSRLASDRGIFTLAADADPVAVEKNYRDVKTKGEKNLLPLVIDLTNPTPALGWRNRERDGLIQRGPADLGMALALVHHLAIGNNLPLGHIAEFFGECCRQLIVEFIPKNDSQVQRLLATREDIFDNYNQQEFEREFSRRFQIVELVLIKDSHRILYFMTRKEC